MSSHVGVIRIGSIFNMCTHVCIYKSNTTSTYDSSISNITDESLINLMSWKNILRRQGRIPKDSKIALDEAEDC